MKLLKYYKNINRFVHKSKTNFVCKNYYFIFPKGFAYLKSFFPLIPLLLFRRKLLPHLSYLDSTVQTSYLLH